MASIHKKKHTIEIWSSYPPPYGGVSVHSMRLYHTLNSKYNLLFKNFHGELSSPQNKIVSVKQPLFEILKNLLRRNKIIHLHSNRILVWFFILFYPSSNKILITLHNESLKKTIPILQNYVVKLFLRKAKFIFLNSSEFAIYLINKYRLNQNKVKVVPAFIPPLKEESEELPNEIEDFFKKHKKTISSFAWKLYRTNNRDVYGIDHIIEAFALVRKKYDSIGLILIIPIVEDQDHYIKIIKRIDELSLNDSILIYNKPVRNGFDVWKRSDVFIRATTTDIEGISIKEALMLDTPVIATNVVARPQGVDLYKYGSVDELCLLINKNLHTKKEIIKDNIITGVDLVEEAYKSLIN